MKITYKILLSFIALICIITMPMLVYRSKSNKQTQISEPTSTPSPTPTPPYLSYLERQADYTGTVESVKLPNEITLAALNQSKLELQLEPNIPIYISKEMSSGSHDITVTTVNDIQIGMTLSVYTKDHNILAIFITK
ncbi:hypothetical protein HGA91_00755 [candidate division WWE3 bacterium]|nr:hypothetical protein [candidate division WWE3 bacterium]